MIDLSMLMGVRPVGGTPAAPLWLGYFCSMGRGHTELESISIVSNTYPEVRYDRLIYESGG